MTDEPTAEPPESTEPGMPGPPPSDIPMEPVAAEAKRPSRTWIWIGAGLIAAVVAVLAVMSISGDGDAQTFSEHGVSFDYPTGWHDLGPATFQVNSGDVKWSESFGAQAGASGAIVTEYALKKDVSSVSTAALRAELDRLFSSTVDQAGGELTQPLSPTTVNGIPGYEVSFTSATGGVDLTTDMMLVFQGTQQWNIQCQYTAEEQQDVLPGCQQIWNTFTIAG